MQNLSYKELQKIEINITKELLQYINDEIDIEEILQELDFIYPYFDDEASRLAFNIWLSMDYIRPNGKTLIESFLEEKALSLTPVEIQILEGKSISHVSIFQVLEYEDDYMHLRDILNNKEYRLWEPHLNNAIHEGEFLFSRIGKLLKEYTFVGDINYLPSSIKPMVLEEILKDFNNIRKEDPLLTMKGYLKRNSLNVYKIYNESILDSIEIDGDIHSYLFDELEEFEGYLLSKDKGQSIQKHLSNLVNLFEYGLSDEDMTLYDLDQLDLEYFFKYAIEEGFISSQDELNSYISTLKIYLHFLSNGDANYKDAYMDILNISKNRFYYMNLLNFENGFQIDKNLVNRINSALNDDALTIIMDFEKFLIAIGEKPLELTTKNKHIKRKYLWEINDSLELNSFIQTSAPNQRDFPLIHFFYYAGLNLKVLEIDNNDLILTNKGVGFLRLKDEEKYSILFKYLWDDDFVREVLAKKDIDYWKEERNKFIRVFSNLKSNSEYNIFHIFPNGENIFLLYSRYLKYLGLIHYDLYIDPSLTITNLGKKIFTYLDIKNNQDDKSTVIHLDNYRNIN